MNSTHRVGGPSIEVWSKLQQALDLLPLMGERVDTAKRRMAAVWENRVPDSLPLLLPGKVPEEILTSIPRFNLCEAYYDPVKMLANEMPELLASALSPGDSIPSIRASMGCSVFPTLLGAVNSVFDSINPWITGHVSKTELSRLTPDKINPYNGEFGRGLEYMAFFCDKLAGKAYVFAMDVQGPIDTAHQAYGDDFFTDLYDDPPFIHHLLELCTTAIIKGVKACKEITGEPFDSAYHYNCLFATHGGIKTSEDTTTLLSAAHIDTYCRPYTQRLLQEFGGGWVHFCGSNPHLYRCCLEMPEVSGVNFGNPERFAPQSVLADCQRTGKVYYGGLRYPDSLTLPEYYQRIWNDLGGKKQGLILQGPAGSNPSDTVAQWRELQMEKTGTQAG